ncbi:MAG: DUF2066 domain-containing protein [Bradyrhizobium icense]|nr:MAG: DUF2066 domain-containing protein [Bradyrhizobium icense]
MGPCVRRDDIPVAGVLRALLTAMLLACLAAPALAEENLYRAQTIVTGTGEANRIIGFATCLEDVLIKVSGQLRLAGDKRLAPFKAGAARFVRDFSYRDEKGGKPKNDEQGTRDRSFVLTAEFDDAAVNGILAKLGAKPWLSRRPTLAVFAELNPGARRLVVSADAKDAELQRAALIAAAARRGMPIVLPDAADLAGLDSPGQQLAAIAPAALSGIASRRGGEVVLTARLVWDDQALRWNSAWQLDGKDRAQRWRGAAVTYDEAFRQGLGAAAQILSLKQ